MTGGLINFRDFGEKATRYGARVRTDALYRSGHMAQADAAAVARLRALDFGLIADLRYADERDTDRSPWPETWIDRVIAHDGDSAAAPHHAMFAAAAIGPKAVDRSYAEFYAALPFDSNYRPLFAETLHRAADGHGRLLVHCSAGKDRTGVLTALLLDTLGVSRADIVADYLLSAGVPQLLALKPDLLARAERSGHPLSDAAVEAMLGVKSQYLEAALAAIEHEAGSVEAYLDAGGVDASLRDRLRTRFLEA